MSCLRRCLRISTMWSATSSGARSPRHSSIAPRLRNCWASASASCDTACNGWIFMSPIMILETAVDRLQK